MERENRSVCESPRHQLTCRRMKDCCAQLHNNMQQWSELNSLSFDTLNNLVNNGMEKRHLVESDLGVLSGVGGVAKRLEAKVVAERERFFVELKRTLGKMEAVVAKIGIIARNLRSAGELLMIQGKTETPVFNTLPPDTFAAHADDIFQAYSEELLIRQRVVKDILVQRNRDTLTVYLSCWLHQPCLTDQTQDKLECLLIETGLRD